MSKTQHPFTPLNIAVLTISDSRTKATDTSGNYLKAAVAEAGHCPCECALIKDDVHHIRSVVAQWIFAADIHVILITGGTGFTGRDSTPEAVTPLLDKEIVGFGELFRHLSYADVGTSTIQSRAIAGITNKTLIFCLPGSTNACKTGWEKIIKQQLDSRHQPCNFVGQVIAL